MKIIIDSRFKTEMTTALLSSPIIYIPHYHYAYVDQALCEILFPADTTHALFDITPENVCEYDISQEKEIEFLGNGGDDSMGLIELVRQIAEGTILSRKKIFLIKGVAKKLEEYDILAALTRFAAKYENFQDDLKQATVIIVDATPVSLLPTTALPILRTIEIPLPDGDTIGNALEGIPVSKSVDNPSVLLQKIVRSLKGLDYYQIETIIDSVLVKTGGCITAKVLYLTQYEKMQMVKKTGILDVIDSDISFDMVGGLDVLRADIEKKACIFQNIEFSQSGNARVKLPKGILILGMPGCGKSMIAKAIANKFSFPLLRLDIGRLMGQYVGQSEENLRKALAIIEATNPCVLWIDELEKAFAGSQSKGGQEDSLVVRLMGTFLTWMQERTTPVYIVATANDVMRSEFMRKGRFDEVYFVDFPKQKECEQILRKKIEHFTKKENGVSSIYDFSKILNNIKGIAKMMNGLEKDEFSVGFSGAEIECVVNTVIENKFIDYLKCFGDRTDGLVAVTENDFQCVITAMSQSAMALQKGAEGQATSIERIRTIQRIHHFKNASKIL